jgi:hypothetical protein
MNVIARTVMRYLWRIFGQPQGAMGKDFRGFLPILNVDRVHLRRADYLLRCCTANKKHAFLQVTFLVSRVLFNFTLKCVGFRCAEFGWLVDGCTRLVVAASKWPHVSDNTAHSGIMSCSITIEDAWKRNMKKLLSPEDGRG